jgi:predicted TIM-barrel fold metal-dependent hydrolase
MSLAALRRVGEQLAGRDEAFYWRVLDEAHIRAILLDALDWRPDTFADYLSGKKTFPALMRLMVPLRLFHVVARPEPNAHTWEGLQTIGSWANHHITSLDEYLEAVFEILKRCKERGAVGLKDQSAYDRSLHYDVVARGDAERIFNRMLADPRTVFGWPDAKPLDDFLFHQFMRFARELGLPVQLHTGHMAGIYNRVAKANAALLTPVLELHEQVQFDLFHGNWPYMGDLLFLAKNYPNVAIDCCWLHIIDPLYAVEMLERAVAAVPHAKLHGFGGDYVDTPEYSAAHLEIARAAIAAALADLVERGWVTEDEAGAIAADWLFNNPNEFFKLGLAPA